MIILVVEPLRLNASTIKSSYSYHQNLVVVVSKLILDFYVGLSIRNVILLLDNPAT